MKRSILAALACAIIILMSLASLAHSSARILDASTWRVVNEVTGPATVLAQVQPVPGAVSGTTVTTTGPVTADTTISIGTYAGQALMWVLTIFSVPIATLIVGALYKLFQRMGFNADEAWRDRLESAIVNAINAVAPKIAGPLTGTLSIDVKSKLTKDVITYLVAHIPDTLSKLGINPATAAGKEVIEGRVEKALNDPAVPTPPSVTPATGMAAHAVVLPIKK